MRYDVGRFRRPMRRGVMEQMVSLISLGDGSTLTLDFTTGVLDSRLTFTRASTATYINSQGYVRYADHNLFLNTAWLTSTTPTTWNVSFGTGTTTWNNDGTVTMTAGGSSVRPSINFQTTTVAQGLPMTFGYLATNVTGSPQVGIIIHSTAPGETYAINGVTVASSTVVSSGDIVSCTFTPTSGTVAVRIGPGSQAGITNVSVTASRPQWNYGTTLQQYQQNTSTSAQLHSPRFDHDPTTLAPSGLLLEGTSTNLLNWSESFATSGGTNNNWADTSITRTTGQADPANGTTAIRFTASAGNATVISSAAIGTSADRTFSVWLRRVTGTGDIQYTQNNGTNWTTQAITSTWTRYTFTHTVDHRVGIRIVTSGNAIEMWGAQLEAGSGASSYIPTGASQATRNADECSMTGTNFSSWFNATEGTLLAHAIRGRTSDIGRIATVNDNTANESIELAADTSGEFIVVDGGSTLANITPGTVTANTAFKIAGAFKVNDVQAALNGTLGTADTSVTLPTVNRLMIGQQAGASPVYLNGTISLLKFWPTRLTDAQLQSLTT